MPDLILTYDGKDWTAGELNKTPNASGNLIVLYEGFNDWNMYRHTSEYLYSKVDKFAGAVNGYAWVQPVAYTNSSAIPYTYESNTLSANLNKWESLTKIQVVVAGLDSSKADNYALKEQSTPRGIVFFDSNALSRSLLTVGGCTLGVPNEDGVAFYFPFSYSSGNWTFTLLDLSTMKEKTYSVSGKPIEQGTGTVTAIKIAADRFDAPDEHEYVDLGLSVKWATMNIGATKPEEFGDYFAWGETAAKETYSWANYKWVQDSPLDFEGYGISKYTFHDGIKDGIWYSGDTFVGDNKMEFSDYDYADDAARKNWKGSWKTPSFNDWIELGNRERMDWTWTDDYKGTGIAGEIVTSKIAGYEGNSIFFPAAGYKYDSYHDQAGSACLYWSSSLMNYSHCGWLVFFLPDGTVDEDEFHRYQGLPVRPVIK